MTLSLSRPGYDACAMSSLPRLNSSSTGRVIATHRRASPPGRNVCSHHTTMEEPLNQLIDLGIV
ncbi:MAG: hypothetical protein WBO67_13880, partial [Nitrospira sp.]